MLTTPHTDTSTTTRLRGLDALRGLAIALMLVDHVLAVWPSEPGQLARLTVTRASLPLFALVAGALARRSGRFKADRLGLVLAWGLAVPLFAPPGIGAPDVLVWLWLGLALVAVDARHDRRLWPALLAVCIIQPITWPAGWTGYEPGTVVALVLVGSLVEARSLDALGARVPRPLAVLGRYPLTLYVGHLALLALVVEVVR